jgi:hypothetical protein
MKIIIPFNNVTEQELLELKLRIEKAKKAKAYTHVKSLSTRLHILKMHSDRIKEMNRRDDNKPLSPCIKFDKHYQAIDVYRPVVWNSNVSF